MSDVFCALRVPERMEYSSLSCGLIPRVHAGEKERNERETSVGKEYWFTRSRLVSLSLSLSLCGLFLSLSLFSRARARVSEHGKVALSENLSHRGIQNRGKEQEREKTKADRAKNKT